VRDDKHIEVLGVAAHSALAILHTLGAVHNWIEYKHKWCAFHTAAAVLDSYAVYKHWKAARAS
jgi:hypothetical protein